jgi:hypothetical protein
VLRSSAHAPQLTALQALHSFFSWKTHAAAEPPTDDFAWPQNFIVFRDTFRGYTWANIGGPDSAATATILGICPLGCRPPFTLADIESRVVDAQAISGERPTTHAEDLEHYLIIELIDSLTARVSLAMLVQRIEWYVLDEHVLSVPAPKS